MGMWAHRLSDVDVASRTANCAACGVVRVRPKAGGWRCLEAERRWKRGNPDTHRATRERNKRPYRASVGDLCDQCGFVPAHPCQLDVDHVNGDHHDNRPENLQTLCANCHRLKTHLERVA